MAMAIIRIIMTIDYYSLSCALRTVDAGCWLGGGASNVMQTFAGTRQPFAASFGRPRAVKPSEAKECASSNRPCSSHLSLSLWMNALLCFCLHGVNKPRAYTACVVYPSPHDYRYHVA